MSEKQINIPDLGGVEQASIVEWLVTEGQTVEEETPLVTLESDKASMDVPSPHAGVVKKCIAKVGDMVKVDDALVLIELSEQAQITAEGREEDIVAVNIPDLGGISSAEVVEILAKVDMSIEAEQPILTLESDKASMDVPAPVSGRVISLHAKVGDMVSAGQLVMMVSTEALVVDKPTTTPQHVQEMPQPITQPSVRESSPGYQQTSPIVRRIAWDLEIDLKQIQGTGRKGRITKDDLMGHIKSKMAGASVPKQAPLPDFSLFGEVKSEPLGKIKRLSGPFLQTAWQTIPHVTQFFEVDLTDLEAYRKRNKAQFIKQGAKLTPILFFMKALVTTLKAYPIFASSLSEDGKSLWLKSYCHIGVAVDTPSGLVVPVIRDVDKKTLQEISIELVSLSETARDKGLKPNQMQGGTMTISSLGGIGGTAFTPIINAPEVCILGISKGYMKPIYQDGQWVPRYYVPLSLSYDHRVIDGAEAARFCMSLQDELENMHKILDDATK